MDQLKISPQSLVASQGTELVSGQNQASIQAAHQLFGCYRKGDANDPEIYTAAIAATLADFTPEVIQYVTDPRTGLPSRLKWLPTVAEVREACSDHMKFIQARQDLIAKGWTFDGQRWRKPGEAA